MDRNIQRLADRERLAQALGWKKEHFANWQGESGFVWMKPDGNRVACLDWNPFVNPGDWMLIAEWAKRQKWYSETILWEDNGARHSLSLLTKTGRLYTADGPIIEALPNVVCAALRDKEDSNARLA